MSGKYCDQCGYDKLKGECECKRKMTLGLIPKLTCSFCDEQIDISKGKAIYDTQADVHYHEKCYKELSLMVLTDKCFTQH